MAGLPLALSFLTSPVPAGAVAAPDGVAPSVAPAGAASAAGAQVVRAKLPRFDWGPCRDLEGEFPRALERRLRCTTIKVPLDYDRPNGPTTRLAVSKVRAAQPGRRIGSLFVNPGGPGGAARGFAVAVAAEMPRVGARFDVIGMDPRGIGASAPIRCRGDVDLEGGFLAFPRTPQEVRAKVRYDDGLRRACAQNGSPVVDHASTADVARDMDLIRRALGEPQMNYYGISYGSFLGATYAALFPNEIRTLIVDGVLDPIAWSSGKASRKVVDKPMTYRLRSGFGAYEALTAAWAECDRVGARRCPLAPASLTKWRQVLRAATQGRLTIQGTPVSYQDVVGFGLSALYSSDDVRFLAEFVAVLHAGLGQGANGRMDLAGNPLYARAVRLRDQLAERGLYTSPAATPVAARAARPVTLAPTFEAVVCSDSRNPNSPSEWEKAARLADKRTPWFGRLWTYSSSPCARQGIGSRSDAFDGPWRTSTSYPVMVVGNSHDPATPISGARRFTTQFRDSVLLLNDIWGHGALGTSGCATAAMSDYLIQRELPRAGDVCRAPRPLFRLNQRGGRG